MELLNTLRADYAQFRKLNSKTSKNHAWPMFFHPRLLPVSLIRLATSFNRRGLKPIGLIISLINTLIFKVEVPSRAKIGSGLVLPHPFGIVLGSAKIGNNVTIFQNVTLGSRVFDGGYNLDTRPSLGNNVIIGCGAVVLGPITVGDGAVVAANSLVIRDVKPGQTVMGVPAHKG